MFIEHHLPAQDLVTIGKVDGVQTFVHLVRSVIPIVFAYLAGFENVLLGREKHNILADCFQLLFQN